MTATTIATISERTGRSAEEATTLLHTPQGRPIEPYEVVELCRLLVSPAGRSINGQALQIDGGEVQP